MRESLLCRPVYAFPNRVDANEDGPVAMGWSNGLTPFGSECTLPINDALCTIHMQRNALPADECRAVINYAERDSQAIGNHRLSETDQIRSIWIEPNEENHWLFHTMGALFLRASQYYGFELVGFVDALQYVVLGKGQQTHWHMDIGQGTTSTRKLSMSLQLSSNEAYEGGDLEFVGSASTREQGAATFFPSYIAHRVAPVEKGTRRVLLAWGCGPSFV